MKKLIYFLSLSSLTLYGFQCGKGDDEFYCTEEFRSVTIRVNGPVLEDFFTIRVSNGDTIRPNGIGVWENYYPVLDDAFQTKLIGKEEVFRFYGKIQNTTVVMEDYLIGADRCHIYKVLGTEEVDI
jgi:hypothetical protein